MTWAVWPPAPGPVTGRFGDSGPDYPAGGHRGLDIGCPEGTTVVAPIGGQVVEFVNDGSFGAGVCIDVPGTPWYVLFAHLSAAKVRPGDVVAAGQPIGLSGASGRVTGAHLHIQVCRSAAFPTDIAQSADPLSFVATAAPGGLEARVAALEARDAEFNRALVAERFELGRLALDADITRVQRALSVLRTAGIIGGGP
jgi:murein DD-endopeptidase MepM/ murein hydrolase activator NlpD